MASQEYKFKTSADERVIDHADHNWEEFHAYLAAELPEWVTRDASGICCHDCSLVIVEQFGGQV